MENYSLQEFYTQPDYQSNVKRNKIIVSHTKYFFTLYCSGRLLQEAPRHANRTREPTTKRTHGTWKRREITGNPRTTVLPRV